MKFELEKLLTVKDTEKAKELIGKKVYLGNSVEEIRWKVNCCLLKRIDKNIYYPYIADSKIIDNQGFVYCYPYEEPKKKLAAFTWEDRELLRGKWVREKDTGVEGFITCFCNSEVSEDWIELSTVYISPKMLLADFTFLDGTPCGKEIEE